jgi:hypothetical protein
VRRQHLLLGSALIAVSVGLVAWGSSRLADAAGQGIGEALVAWSRWAQPSPPENPEGVTPDAPPPAAPSATATDSATPDSKSKSNRSPNAGMSAFLAQPKRGLRVSADTVLQIVRAGVRPSGVFVPAVGSRPAGLSLRGVSGLGLGVEDGDVLTHAGGAPVRSVGDVASVVIAARGQHAPSVSGVIWRGNQPYSVIVEQPYVAPPTSGSADPAPHVSR